MFCENDFKIIYYVCELCERTMEMFYASFYCNRWRGERYKDTSSCSN